MSDSWTYSTGKPSRSGGTACWNRIPRITSGIVESRTDDDLETGEKRGLQPFSIVAQNSEGNDILGVSANDRVSSYTDLMREDRISRQNPLRHPTRSLDWPAWAAMAAAAAGLIGASVVIYSDKVRHGLTCTFCATLE